MIKLDGKEMKPRKMREKEIVRNQHDYFEILMGLCSSDYALSHAS